MSSVKFSSPEACEKQFAEYHLFPNICHVHYRRIVPIVEKTAKEFGLFYNLKPSFSTALASHVARLKQPKVLINQYANHSN